MQDILNEIKNSVAIKHGYLSFDDYCKMGQLIGGENDITDEITKEFALKIIDLLSPVNEQPKKSFVEQRDEYIKSLNK